MESSQLKSISIIGLSVLCLSPIEYFSNKLFENKKENNENIVIAVNDIKLEPNYLANNYEIFNPNIKTASEELEKLASENKKEEISDSENKLESETTKEIIEEKNKDVVVEKTVKKTSTSTKKETQKVQQVQKVEVKKAVETTTVNEEVKVTEETVANTPNTEVAANLVNFAKQFVGNPYRYGGTDLENGIDCSGFTMRIYEHFGYSLPHSSVSQSKLGQYVSIDNLSVGDLIFYGYKGAISHVAIYIGNGQIIHAATNTGGIKIANYQMMPIITARRILN